MDIDKLMAIRRVSEDTGPIDAAKFAVGMTRVDGTSGLTCGVPIADLAVNWDRERADRLFGLIAEDRTEDIGKDICRPTGISGFSVVDGSWKT